MIVIGHKYVRIAHRIIKHLQLNDLRNGSGVLDSRSTQRVGMRECANEIRPVQYHRSSDATYLVAHCAQLHDRHRWISIHLRAAPFSARKYLRIAWRRLLKHYRHSAKLM